MKILDNIKKARLANGFSQEYMADKLEIATVNYGKIERGVTAMTIERLFKIAELLNISVGSLIDIEPSKTDNNLSEKNERLNEKIIQLEEQLNDKRRIVEFLSKNNLLLAVAAKLYHDENPNRKMRDFKDLDSLIKEIDELPYDPADPESQFRYILKRIDEIKEGTPE